MGPPEEQYALLTVEPSPQLQESVLLFGSVLFVLFSVLYARSCYATLAGLNLAM